MLAILFIAAQQPVTITVTAVDYDVVALIRDGNAVTGEGKFSTTRWGYRYFFTSAENRDAFVAEPEKYEVQLGGACGKMGELSGLGSPKIFTVHEDRLYFFASEGCKKGFVADPSKRLEHDIPVPRLTAAAAKLGNENFARLVKWSGGAKAWNDLPSHRQVFKEKLVLSSKPYEHILKLSFGKPDEYHQGDAWNASEYSHAISGEKGYFAQGSKFERPMHPQQVRAAERERDLTYVNAVRAGLRGVVIAGNQQGDVTIYFNGVAVTFRTKVKTGEITQMSYIGRGSNADVGEVTKVLSGFTKFQNVKMPTTVQFKFNGSEVKDLSRTGLIYQVEKGVKYSWS
ncbi:hypothetical protein MCEMSE15_00465 [Fimbriimonadaceae bacterium]